jgi:hypothetical protein
MKYHWVSTLTTWTSFFVISVLFSRFSRIICFETILISVLSSKTSCVSHHTQNYFSYIFYNVTVLDQFWLQVVPCYATEDAVQIVNSFITIPITRNYNHSQLFLTLCHIYTAYNHTRSWLESHITLLHWLISQLSITIPNYHRLYIFTLQNSRRELTPRIHFLRLLLNNSLVGLLFTNSPKTANRFAYIARTSETKNEASQRCCVRSPCLKRRCLERERAAVWRHRGRAQEPYSNAVAWRHRGCAEKTRPPLLPRSAYSVARRLAVSYLATLCCAIQQRVDMSQYIWIFLLTHNFP